MNATDTRTHACISSQNRGGCLAFLRATIWEFIFFQTSAVMIPSSSKWRKAVRVLLIISRHWSEEISGSKMVVRDLLVSKTCQIHGNKGTRCSWPRSVRISRLNGHPNPWGSLAHGGVFPPESPCVMLHSATAHLANSNIDSISQKSSRS